MSAPVTDPIEELLAAALADARTDERWGLAPKAQTLTSVRRAATRQRARNAGLALAAVAGTTAGLAALATGSGIQAVVQQPADGASPQPIPGITPEWIPQSGADWVLEPDAYDAFIRSHTLPSPGAHTVRSPAPLTDYSARLAADVRAVLPQGSVLERQDAPQGLGGAAAIHARLPDGTPVEVERQPMQQPVSTDSGADNPPAPVTRRELPTGSLIVTVGGVLYGWGQDTPGGANTAETITRDGTRTTWAAPLSVSLATVEWWAEAADRR